MDIETYAVTETLGDPAVATVEEAEAVAIAERLGLTGQQKLRTDAATRVAFPRLTAEQDRILTVLCPARAKLKDYEGPIPARVLALAEQHRDAFARLEVWAPDDPRVPDPVLVGIVKDPTHTWIERTHLLARWGDHLDDWDALRAIAARKLVMVWRHAVAVFKTAVDAVGADLQAAVDVYLSGIGEEPGFVAAVSRGTVRL